MTLTPRHNGLFLTDFSALPAGPGPGSPGSFDPGDIGTFSTIVGELEAVEEAAAEDFSETVEEFGAEVALPEPPSVKAPTVAEALMLKEHLHDQMSVFSQLLRDGSPLAGMVGYTWHSEKNFKKAHRWCLGLIAASQAGMPIDFFVRAIVDLYHFDRALFASAHSWAKHAPVRRADIPREFPGRRGYMLRVKPFKWSPTVPDQAVDIVSEFLQETTPDKLWIAEYEFARVYKYDPIIYATFGPWEVELVRWD